MIKARLEQFNVQLGQASDVKHRIFIYYMIFFTVMSLFTVVTNTLSGLDYSYNYKWLFIALTTATFLFLALGKCHERTLHRMGIYFLSLIILPICWLSSSGLVSPSIIYSALALIMINTLVSGWERVFLNLCQIVLVFCLISLFYYHLGLFKAMSPRQQFIDWIINVPVVFGFVALLLTTFEKAYEAERSDNIRHQRILEKLSVTDSLTGLFNRSGMEEKIRSFINSFKRTHHLFSILMIDIDHFKAFNDASGHLVGDQCLKTVSGILKQTASRETDWVCRYGGEEFIMVLGYTDTEGAINIAEGVQANLARAAIPHAGTGRTVTVSIGIATINQENLSTDLILSQADQALYRAKAGGRNRIEAFSN